MTTVIPGASNVEQARQNSAAADLPPLDQPTLDAIENLYDKYFRAPSTAAGDFGDLDGLVIR